MPETYGRHNRSRATLETCAGNSWQSQSESGYPWNFMTPRRKCDACEQWRHPCNGVQKALQWRWRNRTQRRRKFTSAFTKHLQRHSRKNSMAFTKPYNGIEETLQRRWPNIDNGVDEALQRHSRLRYATDGQYDFEQRIHRFTQRVHLTDHTPSLYTDLKYLYWKLSYVMHSPIPQHCKWMHSEQRNRCTSPHCAELYKVYFEGSYVASLYEPPAFIFLKSLYVTWLYRPLQSIIWITICCLIVQTLSIYVLKCHTSPSCTDLLHLYFKIITCFSPLLLLFMCTSASLSAFMRSSESLWGHQSSSLAFQVH